MLSQGSPRAVQQKFADLQFNDQKTVFEASFGSEELTLTVKTRKSSKKLTYEKNNIVFFSEHQIFSEHQKKTNGNRGISTNFKKTFKQVDMGAIKIYLN